MGQLIEDLVNKR